MNPTATYIPKSVIDETLANVPAQGKHALEPLASLAKEHGVPVNILEDHDVTASTVELHRHQADLWLCLEGEATFQVGGTMPDIAAQTHADGSIDDREWKSETIAGAETFVLGPGDILFVPAGVPHAHTSAATARLYIIKLDQPLAPMPDHAAY